MTIFLLLIIVVLSAYAIVVINALENDLNLTKTLLEATKQKRHTHSTCAGLEDAMAIALDIIRENEIATQYTASRAKRLTDVLRVLRSSPHAYPVDASIDDCKELQNVLQQKKI
jgi:hypothetical protein